MGDQASDPSSFDILFSDDLLHKRQQRKPPKQTRNDDVPRDFGPIKIKRRRIAQQSAAASAGPQMDVVVRPFVPNAVLSFRPEDNSPVLAYTLPSVADGAPYDVLSWLSCRLASEVLVLMREDGSVWMELAQQPCDPEKDGEILYGVHEKASGKVIADNVRWSEFVWDDRGFRLRGERYHIKYMSWRRRTLARATNSSHSANPSTTTNS
jgi:hypothetical protein